MTLPSLLEHVQTAKADEPTVLRPDGERISPLAAAIGILVNRLAKLEGGLVLNEGPRAEENEKLLRNAQEAARVAGKEDPREKCVRELIQQGLMSPTPYSLRGRKPDAKQTLDFIRRLAASATYTRANFLTIGSGMLSPYPDTEPVSNPVDCRLTMQIEFLPNTRKKSAR